jgi:hypothetical protein
VKGLLADINVQGQLELLLHVWESAPWREIWESLNLTVFSFEELGLARDVADDVLWETCQQRQIVLLTANRNDEGPDSLEATIRDRNALDSLPVFTLADAQRLQNEPVYAKQTAEKLLDYLFRIDEVRGTGRLYVP